MAVKNYARYETVDHKGKTRRRRNIEFGQSEKNPEIVVPVNGEHLWESYLELSAQRSDHKPITYSDIECWLRMTGTILLRQEVQILRTMDCAYLSALHEEIKDIQARARDD